MLDSRPVGKWTTLGLASTGCGAATRSARATTYRRYCSNRPQGEMGGKINTVYILSFSFSGSACSLGWATTKTSLSRITEAKGKKRLNIFKAFFK